MNRVSLLDTHVLLWAVADPSRLSSSVRGLIERREYAVSVASLWELLNKKDKRDTPVKDPVLWWATYVTKPHTPVIPIRTKHVLYLDRLPWHHRDPYDRILIAQSVVEGMPLVTADEIIANYGIHLRDAGSWKPAIES